MKKTSHIAVIGAGIAGLSCATQLQQAGMQVSVFEKSRGPAGRMSTRRFEEWQCDHGAQYFTARDPDFRDQVADWLAAGVAGLWSPRLQAIGGARKPDPALQRFVGVPRMTAPARLMADDLSVRSQHTIRQLQRGPEGWQLLSDEQGWLDDRFDAVLLAVPSPQVTPLLKTVAPEFAALADSAVMQACWSLMLRYSAPLPLVFDAAFVNEGPLSWIARDSGKPGRSGQETWLLHASPAWSEAHLEDDADSVAKELIAAFAILGAPAPQAWSAHRWRYANIESPLQQGCAWSAESGLGLCGDWINGGKVEGAWLSGRKLATAVLEGNAK